MSRPHRHALIAFVVGTLSCMLPACANDILATVPSPDGRLQAFVFQRSCGATTGFSTQVTVLRAGQELGDEGGNVFVIDGDHGRARGGPGGGPWLVARWVTSDSLEIRYDGRARVFHQVMELRGITVEYVATEPPDAEP